VSPRTSRLAEYRRSTTRRHVAEAPPDGAWLGHGAVGGILGGLLAMAGEVTAAAVTLGPSWALAPIRRAAGILLGPGAVDTSSPAVPVAVAGVLVYLTIASAFGVVFASVVPRQRAGRRRRLAETLLASVAYACALWLVNLHVVAPLFGWDWLARRAWNAEALAAYALLWAPVLALYLHAVAARGRETIVETVEPAAPVRRDRAA